MLLKVPTDVVEDVDAVVVTVTTTTATTIIMTTATTMDVTVDATKPPQEEGLVVS